MLMKVRVGYGATVNTVLGAMLGVPNESALKRLRSAVGRLSPGVRA